MFVPGATRSGLTLPSSVGPRDEKAAIPLALSASGSNAIGALKKHDVEPRLKKSQGRLPTPVSLRLLSVAPTVMTFLAVPGVFNESGSTTPLPEHNVSGVPSVPEFPAAKKMVMSGFSHMN